LTILIMCHFFKQCLFNQTLFFCPKIQPLLSALPFKRFKVYDFLTHAENITVVLSRFFFGMIIASINRQDWKAFN